MILPLTVNALSATTANTIKGTEPYLTYDNVKLENLDKLLSFMLPDGSTEITPLVTDKVVLDQGTKYSDVLTLVTASGSDFELSTVSKMGYDDDDGDIVATPLTLGIAGKLNAEWSYQVPDDTPGAATNAKKKIVIKSSELNNVIDVCNSPYTLTIKASNVKAQSEYGSPRDSTTNTSYVYGNGSKSYTIEVNDHQLCYVKPNSMIARPTETWFGDAGSISANWNRGSNIISSTVGGGYRSDFVPARGFKANPTLSGGKKFPTTGFVGAQFQLVMSGTQTDYSYSVPTNPGGGVVVDTSGNVKFVSKPTGQVTVRATASDGTTSDYSFTPTTVWAKPDTSGTSSWSDAVIKCGGKTKMLTRKELTNSPVVNAPEGVYWSFESNYSTRAIGEGLFPEWGYSDQTTYPASDWQKGTTEINYWTKEAMRSDLGFYFITGLSIGEVGYNAYATSSYYYPALCKG